MNTLAKTISATLLAAVVVTAGGPAFAAGDSAPKSKGVTQGASLTGASLTGASLTGASLTGASLTGASLTGASLTGASLTGASLTGGPQN